MTVVTVVEYDLIRHCRPIWFVLTILRYFWCLLLCAKISSAWQNMCWTVIICPMYVMIPYLFSVVIVWNPIICVITVLNWSNILAKHLQNCKLLQRCVIHFDVFNVTNTHYSFIRLMLQNLNGERYVNTVSNTSTHNERKYRSLSRQIVLIRFLHSTKIMNRMMSIYTRLCLVGCASYCECVCVSVCVCWGGGIDKFCDT